MNSIIISPGKEWQLIWTNPSPTADFSTAKISYDLSNFEEVRVEAILSKSTDYVDYVDVEVGTIGVLTLFNSLFFDRTSTSDTNYMLNRQVTVDTTGIQFSTTCYRKNLGTGAQTTSPQYCIPLRIWAR